MIISTKPTLNGEDDAKLKLKHVPY